MPRRVSLPGADELFRSTKGESADAGKLVDAPEGAFPGEGVGSADASVGDPATTSPATMSPATTGPATMSPATTGPATTGVTDEGGTAPGGSREASGRVRHDEKITVYVTADELLHLEHTRLRLRSEHRLAVDRGRIVREAIHLALEGVEADGEASPLVLRLRDQ